MRRREKAKDRERERKKLLIYQLKKGKVPLFPSFISPFLPPPDKFLCSPLKERYKERKREYLRERDGDLKRKEKREKIYSEK